MTSSCMWRGVGLVKTDISKEFISSFFDVKSVSKLGKTLAAMLLTMFLD
jgi:hypothetical protein